MTNCARFAERPLTDDGTPAKDWIHYLTRAPELDPAGCTEIVVVAAHPDDETLGFGASAAALADNDVRVRVVVASDGGAARPDATPHQRADLERTRCDELREAAEVLGFDVPTHLGLPDGELSDHEDRIADQISDLVDARTWCAANWRGDGHPDHEAVGRAAAVAAQRTGAVLLEYPVWMWHWAFPGDDAVPWHRLHTMPTTEAASRRKAAAVRCYRSQYAGVTPVLPPTVVERVLAVREVVFC